MLRSSSILLFGVAVTLFSTVGSYVAVVEVTYRAELERLAQPFRVPEHRMDPEHTAILDALLEDALLEIEPELTPEEAEFLRDLDCRRDRALSREEADRLEQIQRRVQ